MTPEDTTGLIQHLRTTLGKMEVALDTITDAIIWTDAEGKIQWCDQTFARLLSQPAIMLLGKNLAEVMPLELDGHSITPGKHPVEIVLGGQPQASGIFDYRQDENVLTLEVSAASIQARNSEVSVVTVFHDITRRKQAEREVLDKQERIRLLLDSTEEAIHGLDMDGNCTFTNAACLRMLGYNHESELLGKNMHGLIHHSRSDGSTFPPEECHIFQSIQDGKSIHIDDEVLWRKDGSSFPAAYWSYPAHKEGKVVGAMVTFMDISDKIMAREELEQSHAQLKTALEGTIAVIIKAVEARDPYTAGHQHRVADLACAIANEMDIDTLKIKGIYMGASIHDIGKINVPAEILSKPGKLSDIEFLHIKTHSQVGYDILKDIEFPWPIADIAYQHHERLDGSGYPQGLKGDEICLEAKIVAVADVVEAMAGHRPYRPSLGIDAALDEIKVNRGKLFDPMVVDACLKIFSEKKFSFEENSTAD